MKYRKAIKLKQGDKIVSKWGKEKIDVISVGIGITESDYPKSPEVLITGIGERSALGIWHHRDII